MRHWDIFCQVVDNYGDIGIVWRLAQGLRRRGLTLRLWVDDPSHLQWLRNPTDADVAVHNWAELAQHFQPGAVLLTTFGAALPAAAWAKLSVLPQQQRPVFYNIEHLSAEGYVERMHLLPSPHRMPDGTLWDERYFYPGFSAATGGLLREDDLLQRQAAFDATAWLRSRAALPLHPDAEITSLFAYEPAALPAYLHLLRQLPRPQHLLVCAGRGQVAFQQALAELDWQPSAALSWTLLPLVQQAEFDHILWAADVNFVRGEDSWLRALWAGKPFIWQIYAQDDGVHADKLSAFMDAAQLPAPTQQLYRWWNGLSGADGAAGTPPSVADWQRFTADSAVFDRLRQQQLALPGLLDQLLASASESVAGLAALGKHSPG